MWLMRLNHVFLDTILSLKLSVKFQLRLVTDDMGEETESDFFKQLDTAYKNRYKEKLSKLGLRTDLYLMSADQLKPLASFRCNRLLLHPHPSHHCVQKCSYVRMCKHASPAPAIQLQCAHNISLSGLTPTQGLRGGALIF